MPCRILQLRRFRSTNTCDLLGIPGRCPHDSRVRGMRAICIGSLYRGLTISERMNVGTVLDFQRKSRRDARELRQLEILPWSDSFCGVRLLQKVKCAGSDYLRNRNDLLDVRNVLHFDNRSGYSADISRLLDGLNISLQGGGSNIVTSSRKQTAFFLEKSVRRGGSQRAGVSRRHDRRSQLVIFESITARSQIKTSKIRTA